MRQGPHHGGRGDGHVKRPQSDDTGKESRAQAYLAAGAGSSRLRTMRRSTSVMFVVGLALATGCKHKRGDAPTAGSAGDATTGSAPGSAAPAPTAAGGDVQALPVVTE